MQAWLSPLAEAEQRLHCNNWGAIVGMLVEGTGVGLLPEHWAQALEQDGSLRILSSDPAPGALPYSFQYRRDDSRVLVEKMRTEVMRAVNFSARCRLP
ncbi:lysR substrate binding domain protein [Bordetella holmesii 70147]|nr:lysR substrate binding domain protein [Bordetella holmesii 70147]